MNTGALPRDEGLVALVVDQGADQIRRQQVGGELNPGKVGPHTLRNALGEQGLRDSGHPLDEQVAAGQQPDKNPLHDVPLPDHDPAEFGSQTVGKGRADLLHLGSKLAGFGGAWHVD